MRFYWSISFLVLLCFTFRGQKLELNLNAIPPEEEDFEVEVFKFSDSRFSKVATIPVEVQDTVEQVIFELPRDSRVRLYQIKVTKSSNAAEFLYGGEEVIKLSGDLYDLLNGQIGIEDSKENTAYANLLKILTEYDEITSALQQESSSYSVYDHDFNEKVNSHAALVEEVHHKLNLNLEKIQIGFPETYTAQVLVPLSKIPVRSYKKEWQSYYDGYLSFLHDYFFYFLNASDERMLDHYAFQDKLFQYLNDYVEKEQAATEEAIDALMEAFSANTVVQSFVYNQLMRTYVQLDSEYFVNYLIENHGDGCGLDLSFEELKKMNQITATSVGSIAPDILLYDLENKARSLKSTVSRNDYTVVLFWVGWCEHCKKKMPELIQLATEYKKGVGFFAVSLDADENAWKEASAAYKFPKNWENVCEKVAIEKSTYAPLYNVSTTPAVFLLDKDGKIVGKKLGLAELEAYLEQQ